MRKNKGDMFAELLVGLIIIISVTIMLLMVINRFINSSRFEAQFLSKDLALLIDSVHASPNDITIRYPQKTEQFSFGFYDNGRIDIIKEGQIIATSYFTPSRNIKFINTTLEPTIEVQQEEDKTVFVLGSETGFVPIKISKKDRTVTVSQAISIFSDEE